MSDERKELAARVLDWYRAMGVVDAVAETATDWLARGDIKPGAGFRTAAADGGDQGQTAAEAQASRAQPSGPRQPAQASRQAPQTPPAPVASGQQTATRAFPTAAPEEAVMSAREVARSARDLAELEATLARFDGCGLKATAKKLCFYRGAAHAPVMLIGEAPGRDEDLEGKPFVGRAGQLLDKMLAAAGIEELACHITNIVYWRPPGNRTPTPIEAQVCRPILERQVELVQPRIIVMLGGAAAKHLLGVEDGIMRLRGKWREVEIAGRRIKAMATLHPAYLLRTPAQKRLAWRDMLAVAAELRGEGAR